MCVLIIGVSSTGLGFGTCAWDYSGQDSLNQARFISLMIAERTDLDGEALFDRYQKYDPRATIDGNGGAPIPFHDLLRNLLITHDKNGWIKTIKYPGSSLLLNKYTRTKDGENILRASLKAFRSLIEPGRPKKKDLVVMNPDINYRQTVVLKVLRDHPGTDLPTLTGQVNKALKIKTVNEITVRQVLVTLIRRGWVDGDTPGSVQNVNIAGAEALDQVLDFYNQFSDYPVKPIN
jgi:hypothetical protein